MDAHRIREPSRSRNNQFGGAAAPGQHANAAVTTMPCHSGPLHKIKSIGVIGAGVMGQGIAAANVVHGIPATITDLCASALRDGVRRVRQAVTSSFPVPSPHFLPGARPASLVRGVLADTELAQADLVIEAVAENAAVKKKVLARIEPLVSDGTILASNTSSIPIKELAAGLRRADRFCGLHFCHPVEARRLVEVIPGEKTSRQTVEAAIEYATSIGKLPIVVRDGPGFLINRLLLPYLNEAVELFSEGASIESIESAAKTFGMPVGPLEQLDGIGIDIAVRAGSVMYFAFPDRVLASRLLVALYKAGLLGQKTGAGFFTYLSGTETIAANPEVVAMVDQQRGGGQQPSPEQITMRLFLPMLVEATRVLEEGVVQHTQDVDMALIHGLGFPAERNGLLAWSDTLGARRIVKSLELLAPLGPRYHPTEALLRMDRDGSRFRDERS